MEDKSARTRLESAEDVQPLTPVTPIDNPRVTALNFLQPLSQVYIQTMDAHIESVAHIATLIKRLHSHNQPWRVYHGGSNSTRRPRYSRNAVVDTSGLTNILNIDRVNKRALVEPNISMRQLAEATIAQGLVPAVVMEFPAITVGGGFSGNSGESSSWKHGLFDETIRSIEIVLANGEVKHASETENPDLYHGAAGGHGTLGVVTALEVQLLDSKAFVEVSCVPVRSIEEGSATMEHMFGEDQNLYVDGIMFGPNSGVIMSGHLVAHPSKESTIVDFARAQDQWFYRYIEKRFQTNPASTFRFATPLLSYLFRYDRGAFWGGKYVFSYLLTPFNRVTRFLLDPLLNSTTMFRALHGSGLASQTIVQDIGVPMRNLPAFLDYLNTKFGFHYWWLCPIRHRRDRRISFAFPRDIDADLSDQKSDTDIWVNVGIWGRGSTDPHIFATDNRELEAKTHELGGLKALYARTYYTEAEFWKVYDRELYDEVRRKYYAEGLPSLFDKVRAESPAPPDDSWSGWLQKCSQMRPLPGLWGVLSLLLTSDYLFLS